MIRYRQRLFNHPTFAGIEAAEPFRFRYVHVPNVRSLGGEGRGTLKGPVRKIRAPALGTSTRRTRLHSALYEASSAHDSLSAVEGRARLFLYPPFHHADRRVPNHGRERGRRPPFRVSASHPGTVCPWHPPRLEGIWKVGDPKGGSRGGGWTRPRRGLGLHGLIQKTPTA